MVKNKIKNFPYSDKDEPYLLKIDMDWIPPKELIEEYESFIIEYFEPHIIDKIVKYISPSHNGIHWIIKTNFWMADICRLKLQFILGDDRKRCHMNWQSIQLGMSDWNKLYIDNRYKRID